MRLHPSAQPTLSCFTLLMSIFLSQLSRTWLHGSWNQAWVLNRFMIPGTNSFWAAGLKSVQKAVGYPIPVILLLFQGLWWSTQSPAQGKIGGAWFFNRPQFGMCPLWGFLKIFNLIPFKKNCALFLNLNTVGEIQSIINSRSSTTFCNFHPAFCRLFCAVFEEWWTLEASLLCSARAPQYRMLERVITIALLFCFVSFVTFSYCFVWLADWFCLDFLKQGLTAEL